MSAGTEGRASAVPGGDGRARAGTTGGAPAAGAAPAGPSVSAGPSATGGAPTAPSAAGAPGAAARCAPSGAAAAPPGAGPSSGVRLAGLDAWRGVAVLWMTAFHFCFDLNHAGFLRQDFLGDPFWTAQRSAIVALFLLCAGMGQAVARAQGLGWTRFGRRWLRIAGAALLVTAGSWWMFPRSFIHFGVLHGLAVMLVVARLTAGAGRWLWPLGAAAIASPWIAAAALQGSAWAPTFDGRALNWLGWITRKPFTEDYVPVFPWMGAVWWGVALGQELLVRRPGALAGPARPGRVRRALAWLGRWSLPWYLLHQPVLIGLVSLAALAR